MRLESEEVLCDLHPELLSRLATRRLIGVVTSHVRIIDLEGLLDSLGVQVEDAVEDDLGLLDLINAVEVIRLVLLVVRFVLFSLQLFHLTLAHIDRIVYLEEDRLSLLLVCLLSLQVLDQVV